MELPEQHGGSIFGIVIRIVLQFVLFVIVYV